MEDYEDLHWYDEVTLLGGVDLLLWLKLVVGALLIVTAAAVGVALT